MKERLTGAIILVALMVLLVPELLTGPIRTKSAPAGSSISAIPSVAGAPTTHAEPPLRSYTLTLGSTPMVHDAAPPADAQASAQPKVAEPGAPENSAQETATRNAPQHAPAAQAAASGGDGPSPSNRSTELPPRLQLAESPAHPAVQEAGHSASTGGWVVQLGSFASRQNADRLARSLEGRGFRMSVSPARAGARVLWRVRAGPAHDRAGAQHLAARLRALGHRGELLPVK